MLKAMDIYIAHTSDFISPSAKRLSPKSCTRTGQIMVQC